MNRPTGTVSAGIPIADVLYHLSGRCMMSRGPVGGGMRFGHLVNVMTTAFLTVKVTFPPVFNNLGLFDAFLNVLFSNNLSSHTFSIY